MHTNVTYSRLFEKQVKKLPAHLKSKILFWVLSVQKEGILKAMKYKHYRNEALKGKRQGQYSIRLNKAYRLIYEIEKANVHIHIIEVNKHEY